MSVSEPSNPANEQGNAVSGSQSSSDPSATPASKQNPPPAPPLSKPLPVEATRPTSLDNKMSTPNDDAS